MRKFIRQKSDGFIVGFNETLAANKNFEVFETAITPMPEYIDDLSAFLAPEKKATRKAKKADQDHQETPEPGVE